jgi:hypothetical protein
MRQLAPLFGVSKSAADRIIDHLGPMLALRPRKRFAKDTVLIVDGTLVPTRDHAVAEQSKNYRYSTNHQVVIDADTRLVVVVGQPLPATATTARHGRNPRTGSSPSTSSGLWASGPPQARAGPGRAGPTAYRRPSAEPTA